MSKHLKAKIELILKVTQGISKRNSTHLFQLNYQAN